MLNTLRNPAPSRAESHPGNLYLHALPVARENVEAEVLAGLQAPQKSLPPKFFYDGSGSKLFDQITALPEYYPTRTEQQIFADAGNDIYGALGRGTVLIEPGSGGCHKVQPFLQANQPAAYVPIEISMDALYAATKSLARAYPGTEFHAICADFTQPLQLPDAVPDAPRTVFFPGSTIGNFDPLDAVVLLQQLRDLLQQDGQLLIGVDTKKDASLLNAAYNDSAGITAAFNLNMLRHLNQRLACNFRLDQFDHLAFYNEPESRIEMHLRSRKPQQVQIAGHDVRFAEGETIHTENSYKYSPDEFSRLAAQAGFQSRACWQDPEGLFSVHLMTCAA